MEISSNDDVVERFSPMIAFSMVGTPAPVFGSTTCAARENKLIGACNLKQSAIGFVTPRVLIQRAPWTTGTPRGHGGLEWAMLKNPLMLPNIPQ